MSSLLPDPGASLLDRIKTSMVGLKMPRALETVDNWVGRLDHGEITALEAIEQLLLVARQSGSESPTIRIRNRDCDVAIVFL
jgi:hypothetical protein